MPGALVGPVSRIVDDMLARRERYGFSYYVVSDRDLESRSVRWSGVSLVANAVLAKARASDRQRTLERAGLRIAYIRTVWRLGEPTDC
jgi:hypothetical protein